MLLQDAAPLLDAPSDVFDVAQTEELMEVVQTVADEARWLSAGFYLQANEVFSQRGVQVRFMESFSPWRISSRR